MAAAAEFLKTETTGTTYTGISGSVSIPASWSVPDANDFINFYIGFDSLIEAGISWSPADHKWHYFLNCGSGGSAFQSTAFLAQPAPGDTVDIKLTNDGTHKVSFYVNGSKVFGGSNPSLGAGSTVKQVLAAADNDAGTGGGGTWNVSHDEVDYAGPGASGDVQIRKSNGTYVAWDSTIAASTSKTSRYTNIQSNPLQGSLSF